MRRTRRAGPRQEPLRGEVAAPGDKSISHRALIVAAVSAGDSRIMNLNVGDDVLATARALTALGARCTVVRDNREAVVQGCGYGGLHEPDDVIDAGNSGTTLRLLAGVCASIPGFAVLTGDETLRRRPMLRVVAPLRQMGAWVDGRHHGDRPPLAVRGGPLAAIELEMQVASAQVKSAVLLAGLRAAGRTVVMEPRPTRDHTERMLRSSGVDVAVEGRSVAVEGGRDALDAVDRWVPGDVSSALYLVAAALLVEGSDLTVTGVGLNPTRTAALDVLRRMGADIEATPTEERGGEPVGFVRAASSDLTAVDVAPDEVPGLIDELPLLAVVATQAAGTTTVRGAGELRYKESDRIATLVSGLRILGADVEERPDGFSVAGPTRLRGGEVSSEGDHRIALSWAVAGLVSDDPVTVGSWSAVDTSFPEFVDLLGGARGKWGLR